MEFCTICGNMLFTQSVSGDIKKIKHRCKNCNYEKDVEDTQTSIQISKITMTESGRHTIFMKPDIKRDPTFPRVNNIPCPNEDCPTKNTGEENEVIYAKYDAVEMNYIYLCTKCDHFWKND